MSLNVSPNRNGVPRAQDALHEPLVLFGWEQGA